MDRKEQILRTAYHIVGEKGLEGLHARTVAAALGINHAAVHYHFRTRADLIGALADYVFQLFDNDRRRLMNRAGKQTDIKVVFEQALAYARPESKFAKAWASLFVASIADPSLRQVLRRQIENWTKGFESELAERSAHTSVAMAQVLAPALMGMIVVAHACGEEYPAETAISALASSVGVA